MNYMLVRRLILKDWYMSRLPLTVIAIAGALSTVLVSQRNEIGFAGILSALISLVFLSILVPQVTVMNERKQQNMAFVMSLPISPLEYTTSKVLGNLSAFLVLWIVIASAVLSTIRASGAPAGIIPFGVIAALTPAVAFSLMLCVAIVSESELWTMVTMGATNVAYSFWWILFRLPGLPEDFQSPVPIWRTGVVTVIAVQVAICVVAVLLTFILQSRKRSYV